MSKSLKCLLPALAVLLFAVPSMAMGADGSAVSFSGAIGAGLVVVGAAYGISKLGSAAVESMARQPDVKQNVFLVTLIVAALIEGFTFYAVFVCSTQNPWK